MQSKSDKILPVPVSELPEELNVSDYPFGFKSHQLNIVLFGLWGHLSLLYYFLYLFPFGHVPICSLLLAIIFDHVCGYGITVGCHRYWTHRTFKATLPLQILLMVLHSACMQYTIYRWCRDHRLHHKYTDTDADPHNSKQGLLFSHMGWLFLPPHPEFQEKVNLIEISDLVNDPIVKFQSRHYWLLILLLAFILPMSICKWMFPSMSFQQILVWNLMRYCILVHVTSLVNSVAHIWGYKPYNKFTSATESPWVAFLTDGEGWHNYHHTFPWDYKTSEIGWKLNTSTMVIDFFAWLGWAYDLKTTSEKTLTQRIIRTGDGSHSNDIYTSKIKHFSNVVECDEKCTLSWH